MIRSVIVSLLALLSIPSSALAQSCAANPIAVQILGSGGPRVNRDRASSSYLLWIDAQARILVDMGGGAFLRFGQAQAKLSVTTDACINLKSRRYAMSTSNHRSTDEAEIRDLVESWARAVRTKNLDGIMAN